MKTIRSSFMLVASTALLVVLASCQPFAHRYTDRYYDSSATMPLTMGEPQEGTWETFELTVRYRYQLAGELQISGTATLGRHYRDLYERIKRLDFYLFLLDDTSKVLETLRLGQAIGAETDTVLRFTETIALPPGTNRIGFGYEGRVVAGDPDPGNNSDWFYKLPLSRHR